MKAVILAAGKSTRTYPLTLTRPKPMLKVLNKPILEHTLNELTGLVDEVVVVVNYLKEQIIDYFGNEFKGINIKYVTQKEAKGTGNAVLSCREYLEDRFLVLNGDDIYHRNDLKNLISYRYGILAKEVSNPSVYGVLDVDEKTVKKIIEKPENPPSNLVNIGAYVFDKKIFEHELIKSTRGEYEITDYVNYLIESSSVGYSLVNEYWHPIGYPWELLNANEFLIKRIKSEVLGTIEEGAVLKGKIQIGKRSLIKSGAYIEGNVVIGDNCIIGPNCYIRDGTVIGDNCKVGNGCEVQNSILFSNVACAHLSYIGDSIIGSGVNIGGGTITSNLRHDRLNVHSLVKGKLINTGRRKFGCIISDNVSVGINNSIYPGRKIWPNMSTKPGLEVKSDLEYLIKDS